MIGIRFFGLGIVPSNITGFEGDFCTTYIHPPLKPFPSESKFRLPSSSTLSTLRRHWRLWSCHPSSFSPNDFGGENSRNKQLQREVTPLASHTVIDQRVGRTCSCDIPPRSTLLWNVSASLTRAPEIYKLTFVVVVAVTASTAIEFMRNYVTFMSGLILTHWTNSRLEQVDMTNDQWLTSYCGQNLFRKYLAPPLLRPLTNSFLKASLIIRTFHSSSRAQFCTTGTTTTARAHHDSTFIGSTIRYECCSCPTELRIWVTIYNRYHSDEIPKAMTKQLVLI